MKMLGTKTYIFAIFITFFISNSYSNDLKSTGIYSSLSYNNEGGDLLGIEILVFLGDIGYFVLFQSAEGEPYRPEVIPAKINGNIIKFTLSDKNKGYSGEFIGEFNSTGLSGQFSNGQLSPFGKKKVKLLKGQSYWQR